MWCQFVRFVLTGSGGAVTRQAALMEFQEYGGDLLDRFVTRIQDGPLWTRAANHLFVYAAFHPRMLDVMTAPPNEHMIEAAIHGTGTARERREGIKARSWVDQVPKDITVIVGHAVTPSGEPETVSGKRGGTAIFADTGFWRDVSGQVPFIDIPMQQWRRYTALITSMP